MSIVEPKRDTDDWYEWSERAAIRELDGGLSREEAERLALEDLKRCQKRREEE